MIYWDREEMRTWLWLWLWLLPPLWVNFPIQFLSTQDIKVFNHPNFSLLLPYYSHSLSLSLFAHNFCLYINNMEIEGKRHLEMKMVMKYLEKWLVVLALEFGNTNFCFSFVQNSYSYSNQINHKQIWYSYYIINYFFLTIH